MKKYGRWIIFGLIAIACIAFFILVGANKKMRQRISALLTERLIRNRVRDLQDKAAVAQAKAQSGKMEAEEAEKVAKEADEAIKRQEADLQKKLENQGLSNDEISTRINNLRV